MRGLFNIVAGVLGTIVVWALVVGAFWLFAASVLYIASRVLPLRRQRDTQRRSRNRRGVNPANDGRW